MPVLRTVVWWRHHERHAETLDLAGMRRILARYDRGECTIESINGIPWLQWLEDANWTRLVFEGAE